MREDNRRYDEAKRAANKKTLNDQEVESRKLV